MPETSDQELLRVKLVPLKSTWTCPKCQRQNIYTEGVVSRPQNICLNCGMKVQIGTDLRSLRDCIRALIPVEATLKDED